MYVVSLIESTRTLMILFKDPTTDRERGAVANWACIGERVAGGAV